MRQTTRAMSGPAVQRWRVVYTRHGAAVGLAQRDAAAAWEAAIAAGGLPVAISEGARPRPRLMFGPPLSAGFVADEELVDLFLVERLAIEQARGALERSLPAGHVLIGLHDVWIGAPSLAASVVAADFRVELGETVDDPAVSVALDALIEADRIPRERQRGGRVSTYDLRPLIDVVRIVRGDAGSTLEMRLRIDQQGGTGRPEEVLAAMLEMSGLVLKPRAPIARGRLYLSPA